MRESKHTGGALFSDQATGLRNWARERSAEKHRSRKEMRGFTRVISFTSGKGGVGKTNTVVNTAISLAERGRRVLILDADLGLANVDILLNLRPKYTIFDVLSGEKTLSEVMVTGPMGITIIPAASGIEGITDLDIDQKQLLLAAVEESAADFDYVLIDTRAGISSDVMYFNAASSEIVCIINNQPTSLTDAYALIKVLSQNYGEREILVLVNDVPNEIEGQRAFRKLAAAAERHLGVRLTLIGIIPEDPHVNLAVQEQIALVELFPSSDAARAIAITAMRLDEEFVNLRVKGGMQFFFRQLLETREAYGV